MKMTFTMDEDYLPAHMFRADMPLHFIKEDIFDLIHKSNIKAVKAEISRGTDVNLRNNKGQTLLHYSLLYNQIGIAKFLIDRGAILDTEDYIGGKVKFLIMQEHYQGLHSRLSTCGLDCHSTIQKEQIVFEDSQVKELGNTVDWCCTIL